MAPAALAKTRRAASVGVAYGALILASVEVPAGAVALLDRVGGAAEQHLLQFLPSVQPPDAASPDAPGDRGGKAVHDPFPDRRELSGVQIGGEQADAA